jgi:hypothetical protein
LCCGEEAEAKLGAAMLEAGEIAQAAEHALLACSRMAQVLSRITSASSARSALKNPAWRVTARTVCESAIFIWQP